MGKPSQIVGIEMTYDEAVAAAEQLREGRHPRTQLADADLVMAVIDDMVYRHLIDARSALADQRLEYGEPFSRETVDALLRTN
jgi:hypothetical protein